MEERLISRFGWGLTVAIEPPELEMRVAIVLKKAEAEAVALSEEIAFFIAKHIRSNVRELEGALKKVLAFARFTGRELSLDLAKEALRDILNLNSRQVSVEGIQKTVAEYFKIKMSDMHSKKRSRNIARPRQVAMALAKELTQMSLPEIGEAFGNLKVQNMWGVGEGGWIDDTIPLRAELKERGLLDRNVPWLR